MNGTNSTLPPTPERKVREFALRFTGDRRRLRLDFNKQVQEALGIAYGDQVIVTANDEGEIIIRRVNGEKFGDPSRSEKIAGLRHAQRAHGLREVAAWNLLLKSKLRMELGTAEPSVVVPTPIAADFAWWLRGKLFRERRLIQKRIAVPGPGDGAAAESADTGGVRPRRLRRKA